MLAVYLPYAGVFVIEKNPEASKRKINPLLFNKTILYWWLSLHYVNAHDKFLPRY